LKIAYWAGAGVDRLMPKARLVIRNDGATSH